MNAVADLSPAVRRLAGAWLLLAVSALGLSALFAVVLVLARTPFIGLGSGAFRTALVLHVDMAVVVWFLSAAAGVWTLTAGQAGRLAWAGFGAAVLGAAVVVASPFVGSPPPILANYVPVLDSTVFFSGLGCYLVGVALAGLVALGFAARRREAAWQQAVLWSIAIALLAAALLVWVETTAPEARAGVAVTLDDRLWASGHTLQFVHVLLLMAAWSVLGDKVLAQMPRLSRCLPLLFALAALPAFGGLYISVAYPVGSGDYRDGFTALMRWGSWPAAALLGLGLLGGLLRRCRVERPDSEAVALMLSILLFASGCVLGATIRGDSVAVPAHYHGTVGAVTLAYLLWGKRLLPRFGTAWRGGVWTQRLPLFYGGGIAILIAGLAWSGALGVPRKAPHAELTLDGIGYLVAMGAAGVGGFIALTAVAAFVGSVFRTLAGRAPVSWPRVDSRPLALGLTLLLVVGGGWLLSSLGGGSPGGVRAAQSHVADKKRDEVAQRFEQGVIMLHAKQYDHALTAFHRVLQLAPEMPEAYVNAGFALLGLKQFPAARDFFESAIDIRRDQLNAYYGLAEALEAQGDVAGAVGAMRSYVHLSKADDPFRRKAEAALWEWEAALQAKRTAGG